MTDDVSIVPVEVTQPTQEPQNVTPVVVDEKRIPPVRSVSIVCQDSSRPMMDNVNGAHQTLWLQQEHVLALLADQDPNLTQQASPVHHVQSERFPTISACVNLVQPINTPTISERLSVNPVPAELNLIA